MQFNHFRVQLYPKLHEKACNYLLIIYFIFQDSYMRSGDMSTFLGLLFRRPRLRSYVILMFPLFK